MDNYLGMPAVMGFHISGFNILIESESDLGTSAHTDINATMEFLHAIKNRTEKYSVEDGLAR